MKTILLKPAAGVRVLDPNTAPPSPLPAKGRRVALDSYWRRRLRDGDVVEAQAGAAQSKPATKAKAKE